MTDKPKALELADLLDSLSIYDRGGLETEEAIAELRRLHEVNQAYVELVDALSDTLMEVSLSYPKAKISAAHKTRINAALAKAKEST